MVKVSQININISLIEKPLNNTPRGMKRFRARFICHAFSKNFASRSTYVYLYRVLNHIFLCRGSFYYLLFSFYFIFFFSLLLTSELVKKRKAEK